MLRTEEQVLLSCTPKVKHVAARCKARTTYTHGITGSEEGTASTESIEDETTTDVIEDIAS